MAERPAALRGQDAPLDMGSEEFRDAGHYLVDRIADFLAALPEQPVTRGESPAAVQALVGDGPLPRSGAPAAQLLREAGDLLLGHSVLYGHPRFWGFITPSAAPIGALGDLLTAAVNTNVRSWTLSPIGTTIEAQTVRWIAELLGYPAGCGGLLLSGGTMANVAALIAARKAKASWDVRSAGVGADGAPRLRIYASSETHTWIQKAADLSGLGTDSIRWVPADESQRMDVDALRRQIESDRASGELPFLVVGTAGTVSTGAIDPLPAIAAVCRELGLWFHVDGAYGAVAACLPDAPDDLKGLREADSVAMDPHKWLYAPLDAGCVLVRDPNALRDAFGFTPPYYHQEAAARAAINYYEHGPQNARSLRALKVWLGLRQAGREGYARMVAENIRLSRELHARAAAHPELEACTQGLSIATFRYVPADIPAGDSGESYLNALNTVVLERLQSGGEAFVSNAVIGGRFVLRACIVNFRTSLEDVAALPEIVARTGREADAALRPQLLAADAGI
jgi:glutamate/tyrosine decarboxylase-like PLP-dependent enzyme